MSSTFICNWLKLCQLHSALIVTFLEILPVYLLGSSTTPGTPIPIALLLLCIHFIHASFLVWLCDYLSECHLLYMASYYLFILCVDNTRKQKSGGASSSASVILNRRRKSCPSQDRPLADSLLRSELSGGQFNFPPDILLRDARKRKRKRHARIQARHSHIKTNDICCYCHTRWS